MATTSDSLRSFSDKALNTTESLLTKPMSVFGNNYLKNIMLVVLLLYAPVAAPTISPGLAILLQNYAIKLIYIFILAYLLSGSIRVSVVTAVVIVLGIFLLKKLRTEHFEENVENEENVVNNQKQMLSESVIEKQEMRNSSCTVSDNIEPNSINNVTEYNAMANHEDTLHPEYLKDMKSVETNTNTYCNNDDDNDD